MHGFWLCSEYYVFVGRNRALPYFLADYGYDVWLGNDRGSFYHVEHEIYNKSSSEFWNFSLDDIGYYDYKAMMDLILRKTKASTIDYIGHSQGGSGLAIFLSSFPEYRKKIRQAHLFSPAMIVQNSLALDFLIFQYNVSNFLLYNLYYNKLGANLNLPESSLI